MSSSVSALTKNFIIIFYIIWPLLIAQHNSIKIKRKIDSWQSALPVPLPEPIDSGIPISSINNYDDYKDDDDDEDEDNDDSTFHYNHIIVGGGGDGHQTQQSSSSSSSSSLPVDQKLDAGHRCLLASNETEIEIELGQNHLNCKEGLQCRNIPPDIETSYGKCIQMDCSPDCRHRTNGIQLQCPEDSDLELRSIEYNGQICCFRYCKCNKCLENREKCKRGYLKLQESNGMPGRCCDLIKCSHVTLRNCTGNQNRTFDSGETWNRYDDCHHCKCIDGVWKCESINNCPEECLPQNSSLIKNLKPDQCCLPCKGCIYEGKKYEHQQKWLDNDCRRCECRNEKYVCDIEFGGPKFCDRPCNKNEKREWNKDQCCDKCQCQLNCLFGYKINQTDGSRLCQCQDEQQKYSIDSTTTISANISSSLEPLNNCEKQDLNEILRIAVIVSAVLVFGIICIAILSFYFHYPSRRHHHRRRRTNKRSINETLNNERASTKTIYGSGSYPDNDPIESKLMLNKPEVETRKEEKEKETEVEKEEEEEETKMIDR